LASLEDVDTLATRVEQLRTERTRLFSRLQDIPYLEPSPSQANFILCRVRNRQATELKADLLKAGILVRYYDTPQLRDYIRVTVGKPQDTDRLALSLLALEPDPDLRDGIAAGWTPAEPEPRVYTGRTALVKRETGETRVLVELNLDGSGQHSTQTGLPFLDHMLAQVAVHGLFDLRVEAQGDLEVDSHHTVEDVGLALGEAFARALGERKGIVRAASALVPMDDTLAEVALDFSGRPYSITNVDWHTPSVGGIANSQWPHFLESFALRAGLTLHVAVRYGRDDHHQIEAIFKGLARSLDRATQLDPRRCGLAPSTKGTLIV
jgi:imidazoleglycerol-phosphate dehydratase